MRAKVAIMGDGSQIEFWDDEAVRQRLLEMGDTLRRLSIPGCWPAGYRSNWPDYVSEFWDNWRAAYEPDTGKNRETKVRPGPPTAAAITRMDEAVQWFHHVDHTWQGRTQQKRATLWAYAMGVKMAKIARETGWHRETIRAWVNEAIDDIVRRLNTEPDGGK